MEEKGRRDLMICNWQMVTKEEGKDPRLQVGCQWVARGLGLKGVMGSRGREGPRARRTGIDDHEGVMIVGGWNRAEMDSRSSFRAPSIAREASLNEPRGLIEDTTIIAHRRKGLLSPVFIRRSLLCR